jgi:5S rRNA maturation endonuclease (ribonuclease M5)
MPDQDNLWKRYKQAVLERVGDFSVLFDGLAKQKPSTDGWVTALCPFHEDKNPSFAFNRNSGRWCCFAGCGKGSAFDYLMQTSGKSFKDALLEVGDRVGVPRPFPDKPPRPPIREALVKQWVGDLWANEEVCRWLREKRGLSDATLKKYEIGWDPKRQRNTIPIRDERGNVMNVRLYNAKKDPKIINYTEGRYKYGSPARLYGIDELAKYQGKQVILCEGEWDRLILQQEGFMAVTGTHGASVFRPEWIAHFKGKDVVILYDCDREGQAAASNVVLRALKTSGAASVKNVVLPLKGDKDDKDVTDYFHKRGLTAADLQKLIDETPAHSYEAEDRPEEILTLESFTEVERKDLIDKKVRCEITACGETSEAFHAVEEFRITFCPRMQKGGCFECKGVVEPAVIPKGAQEYIGSCMSTNVQLKAMLREYACKYGQKPTIEILRRTTVKEFFCHQKVNRITQTRDEEGNVIQVIDGKKQELLEKRVYFLSSEHPKPGNYLAVGWVKSHPKTQQVTFLIDSMEPLEDDFESFRVEENVQHLRAFQSLSWAQELSAVYGYAVDVPLITLSDCRNNLARVAAAFAALLVSADEHFARLVIEPKHVRMAAEFLSRLYSHDNCSLDDYSEICRASSQLVDYDQIEGAFLKKWERAKHAGGDDEDAGYFPRLIFILRVTKVIRRDDLAEQAGCSLETVKRTVRLLKRFNLLDTTRDGYVKKPKFNKFLRRFVRKHPKFLEDGGWGSGLNPLEDKDLDAISTET